jgi:hypothetical protein
MTLSPRKFSIWFAPLPTVHHATLPSCTSRLVYRSRFEWDANETIRRRSSFTNVSPLLVGRSEAMSSEGNGTFQGER